MLENLDLSLAALAFVWLAAFLGALVQGAIGFGLNLIVVPVVAIVRPSVLPAAGIILAIPMTLGSALREHAHIDREAVVWTTLGRLPGVVLGAWIVTLLSPAALSLVIGGVVLVAVAMSLVAPRLEIDPRSQAAAGFLGGLFGTASSIGGPPMALLYQHEPGPVVRSTLGATFLLGTVLSLSALGVAGEVASRHWLFGLLMMPALLAGLFASRFAHGRLDTGWLRPGVLVVSTLAALAVFWRAI